MAGIPPDEVFVSVQLLVAASKVSEISAIIGVPIVEEEDRSKLVPEHIDVADAPTVTGGAGTTSTCMLAVVEQAFKLRVYTYVTKTEFSVVLSRISLIAPVPDSDGLEIPVTAARVQLKLVPGTELVGV